MIQHKWEATLARIALVLLSDVVLEDQLDEVRHVQDAELIGFLIALVPLLKLFQRFFYTVHRVV